MMRHSFLPLLAAAVAAGLPAASAVACPAWKTAYIGTICSTAASYCPEGYLPADGAEILVKDYGGLYAVIGHTYDHMTTEQSFRVPDLRGRTPVAVGSSSGVFHSVSLGEKIGADQITLTEKNLPEHFHTMQVLQTYGRVSGTAGDDGLWLADAVGKTAPEQGVPVTYEFNGYLASGAGFVTLSDQALSTDGGASQPKAFSPQPPALGTRFCILYKGAHEPSD